MEKTEEVGLLLSLLTPPLLAATTGTGGYSFCCRCWVVIISCLRVCVLCVCGSEANIRGEREEWKGIRVWDGVEVREGLVESQAVSCGQRWRRVEMVGEIDGLLPLPRIPNEI